MKRIVVASGRWPASRVVGLGVASFLFSITLSGCLVIGGRSSRGGLFFWPGGIGGLIVVLLVLVLLRRR